MHEFLNSPDQQEDDGWRGGGLLADFGDAHLLDVSGEHDEDGVGDGRDLPRSYQLSSSFCSESAKRG